MPVPESNVFSVSRVILYSLDQRVDSLLLDFGNVRTSRNHASVHLAVALFEEVRQPVVLFVVDNLSVGPFVGLPVLLRRPILRVCAGAFRSSR